MNIGIVGAGAIGVWIGSKLAAAGDDVSFLARGETLDALQKNGAGFQEGDNTYFYDCHAASRADELGVQDVLIIAVKGPALPDLAPSLKAMIGPHTLIVSMLNGVPWWFMEGSMPLTSLDPVGDIDRALPRENILGCVVYAGAASPQKGVSKLHFINRIILGETDGAMTGRLTGLVDRFIKAGISSASSTDIRSDIWAKLLGNMTLNPMSALTLATLDHLTADPLVRELIKAARDEAKEVGEKIGCSMTSSDRERKKVVGMLDGFKTSMLQDVEAGRHVELDTLLAAPIEIAEKVGVDVPTLRGVFGLTRVMAKSRGLY